ncbi:rRNA methyltransferase 1, mitochondrial [Syngnathus acus]|uniref:rRNA methyltransferase 1, mitochondrial n=1 Tax=Syngnathus acus TaxID=161584 RepID=UPI001885EDAE|nr:rRNA methyltransferase 1, mitochondrial [Syngnathus acus]
MGLFNNVSKHRLLFMRMWRFPKVLDSYHAYHKDNRVNHFKTPSKSKMSGGRLPNDKALPNKLNNQRRVSSELQRLAVEDSSSQWEKTERLKPSMESSNQHEIVFGVAPCHLALTQTRRKALKLFVKDGEALHRSSLHKVYEEAHRRQVPIQRVSKKDLDRMVLGRVHQGVCLQATPLSYLAEDSAQSSKSTSLWLVLDGIQDPMNLGAILRSAYFLGVDRVASSIRNSCPLTPVVSKASAGIMEVMGVYGYKDLEDMVRVKAAQGWRVVGTVAGEAPESGVAVMPCSDFRMTAPTLLLIGGEGDGLSRKLLALCQTLVTIPAGRQLLPGIESLNVSVATGILLHSLLASIRH